MSKYQKLLLGAILGRVSTILLVLLGIILMPKDQHPLLIGLVVCFLGAIGWGQIQKIIDYLAMDRIEFIRQIKWEREQ